MNELDRWFQSSRGSSLVRSEVHVLAAALDDCFGWELVQLGGWSGTRDLIAHGRTRRKTLVTSVEGGASSDKGRSVLGDVHARLSQLPLASDSVDAVLLPHTLEFETDPYPVLREADRVLTGEGKLLILGFKPISPWGLRSMSSRHGFPPTLRRVLPERRIRDWLSLLGYEVAESRGYLYELPWGEPGATPRLKRGWFYAWPSGAYLIKARKRVFALPSQRLRLRDRARAIGGLIEPSSANRQ